MTDWDEIVEYIHHAMQAVEEAHQATEQLRKDANHENFRLFRDKMRALQERQAQLMTVLGDEEAYAIDELVDALSLALRGQRAEWRRTPRLHD